MDWFNVMGTRHMDNLVSQYAVYDNTERPHSALQFRTPTGPPHPMASDKLEHRVRCQVRLGGVLRHYYRAAG